MNAEIITSTSLDKLCEILVEKIQELAHQAIEKNGKFTLALSGGNTPKTLFNILGNPPYKEKLPWDKMFIFWVDERAVPPDDDACNFKMANEFLLCKINVPSENIFRMKGEAENLEAAASKYETLIKKHVQENADAIPAFDLILLGMGGDGHLASLFPGENQTHNEKEKLVIQVISDKGSPPVNRLTMTFPLLNNAENLIFLVSEKGKKEVIKAVLYDTEKAKEMYPTALLEAKGKTYWYIAKL